MQVEEEEGGWRRRKDGGVRRVEEEKGWRRRIKKDGGKEWRLGIKSHSCTILCM